ncbi:MAG TPA: hypothetical protein DCO79_14195 [Spirochaeta sp.]|nr:hypothetical protein [Spirochaeta sp.]
MEQNIHESLPVIFSNLQKASEKQQNYDSAEHFGKLSEKYYQDAVSGDLRTIKDMIVTDISSMADIQSLAGENGDRGILRALRWGGKVAAIQKSLIDRYLSKGEALTEGKEIFLCEACGFIFLGNAVPGLCPVCKAPSSRFTKVGK